MKAIKYSILLTIWALTLSPLFLYSQWIWQNPLPQGNSVLNLNFLNENIGFVVGNNGTILKTIDGGDTWIHQESGTYLNLTSIHMSSNNIGFAVGGNIFSEDSLSIILKTTNGGNNWSIVYQDSLGAYSSVCCASNDSVFVAGKNGIILRSVDGGNNWTSLTTGITTNIYQIEFPSTFTGYAIADDCEIIKTSNGGLSWEQLNINTTPPANLESMSFPTEHIGYILVYDYGSGFVLKTIDGGGSWFNVLPHTVTPYSIDFCSPDIGYVAAAGRDKITLDGGQTWEGVNSSSAWGVQIELINSDVAYATAGYQSIQRRNHIVYKTINGGNNWHELTSSFTYGNIKEVAFPNNSVGYALSRSMGSADILKTYDGYNWETVFSQDTVISDIYVLNENNIYFASDYWDTLDENAGLFGKSHDGGTNWEISDLGYTIIPKSLHFTSNTTGFLLSSDGLYKTDDEGQNWYKVHSDTLMWPITVYFSSYNNGYILEKSTDYSHSLLLRSEDGGNTWNHCKQFDSQFLRSIFFLDDSTGYVITSNYLDSYLYFTTNGGDSWDTDTIEGVDLNNIFFNNDSVGCLVGSSGEILQTKDGGENWTINKTVTDNPLYGVYFKDNEIGYITGYRGTILYTDSCTTRLNENLFEPKNSTLWIFPNPSSGKTNIAYSLDKISNVMIEVFNISGQSLKTINLNKQNKGKHKYTLNTSDFDSGLYIVQLRINNNSYASIAIIK